MANWIKGAIKRPGALTKKARNANMSLSEYIEKTTSEGSNASTRTKRQANLAKTLRGFHR
jgi:DNA-binding phage protein